jgi:hypothetical protein
MRYYAMIVLQKAGSQSRQHSNPLDGIEKIVRNFCLHAHEYC